MSQHNIPGLGMMHASAGVAVNPVDQEIIDEEFTS